MKKIVFLLFLNLSSIAFAQNEIPLNQNQTYINAQNAFKNKNYQQAINLSNQIIDAYYTSSDLYTLLAKSYYYLGKHTEASKAINFAYGYEPIYDDFAFNSILISTYNKDIETVKQVYYDFSFYGNSQQMLDYYESTVSGLLNYLNKNDNSYGYTVSQVQQQKELYQQNYKVNAPIFYNEGLSIYNLGALNPSQIKAADYNAKILALKKRVQNNTFPVSYYNQLLVYVANYVPNNPDSDMILNELFNQFKDARTSVPMRFRIYKILADVYQVKRNYENEIAISNIMFDDLKKTILSQSMKAEVLNHTLFPMLQLGKYNEALEYGKIAESILNSVTNKEQKLLLCLNTSKSFAYSGNKQKALQLAERSVQLSKQFNAQSSNLGKLIEEHYNSLTNDVSQNTISNHNINTNDYIALYNSGLDLIGQKKYAEAIPFLEKAKINYEAVLKKANKKERNSLFLFYAKVGGCLIACYQETNQQSKIFPVMEAIKTNNLAGLSTAKKSLSEIQNTLKNDEALVYYVEVSRGFTYEGTYLAAVITKNSFNTKYVVSNGALMNAYVKYNNLLGIVENEMAEKEFRKPTYTKYSSVQQAGYNNLKKGEVSLLIELYRKFLNPNEGGKRDTRFTNEIDFGFISNSFFIDYVSKLEPFFKNKKKVIFALDGIQNLIPFETLVDLNSVYLIEKYDVSYISSGSLLKSLRDRKPNSYTKNVLAFGDAKYAKLENPGFEIKSLADIDRIRNEVIDLQAQNKPLDKAFATFSKEPMNYLQGAKAEVEFIGENISNADVKLDNLMTENEFKKMSSNNELSKYKVIHLSSHAMVHPYIFELSSIAFSVYPTPVNGEDGMLTVAEMEKLNLKTDLMMLSACQTGLGKIVPGEGVQGLNQSMINAGANSTITTLWSVNDYGSYIFTANLYTKIFKQNLDYDAAVNQVKREFIKGTYNREGFNGKEPMFWAPFIYTGK